MMENEYKKILERLRVKFLACVTTDRLLSPLLVSHVISSDELQTIQNEPQSQKVGKLLDVVQRKDFHVFKRFCVVLETTFPYMLNCMFLGVEPPAMASARLEKANQNKTENEVEANSPRHIKCGTGRTTVGRSTSMTGHDLCKDRYSLLKNELKAVKWELEQARVQLHRTERERDQACRELAEVSGQKSAKNMETSINSNTNNNNNNNNTRERSKDYQRLKHEYVNVLTELQILRQRNSDLNEKYDVVSQEADYFRKQHRTVLNKCDLLVREAQSLQRKYEESLREQEKMKQDYEEIVLLREREKKDTSERFDVFIDESSPGDRFAAEVDIDKDYEIQQTHRELRTEYNHVFNQLKSLELENGQMKEQFDSLIKERDALITECNALKQQCDNGLRNIERAARERDTAVKSSQQALKERDAALRDCDQIMSLQVKTAKELAKLTEERNAVIGEYRLIMSERDNVHRETDKIQEDLHKLQERNETISSENKQLYQLNKSLQDELNVASAERTKLGSEVSALHGEVNGLLSEKNSIIAQRDKAMEEYEMFKQERDAARKERSEALIHRDKILKECFRVEQKQDLAHKGEANEKDSLKKKFQLLSKELTSSLHEADVSKQRCDWALNERDRAIAECKKLQSSYDLLHEEHERTVTDLTEIVQDSENVRAQHAEMMIELMDLRTRIETQLSAKSSSRELVSSRDSAIDTDSTEWEMESVVLEKPDHHQDVGITIGGGHDAPVAPHDTSIIITDVTKGSLADGKLRINDHLLKVNDVDLTNVAYHTAVQAISEANVISLTVRRRRSSSVKSLVQPVRLTLSDGKELGIHIDNSKFISFISPGSTAALNPMLAIGDKIVEVNGQSVENLSQLETEKLLCTSTVSLAVLKPKSAHLTQAMQSLLEEVNEKMSCESDLFHHLQTNRKRILMNDSYSEMGGFSRHAHGYSGRSSPTEEGVLIPDCVSEPVLNSSPSLTPLYEERCQETPTDSSTASVSSENVRHSSCSRSVTPNQSSPLSELAHTSPAHLATASQITHPLPHRTISIPYPSPPHTTSSQSSQATHTPPPRAVDLPHPSSPHSSSALYSSPSRTSNLPYTTYTNTAISSQPSPPYSSTSPHPSHFSTRVSTNGSSPSCQYTYADRSTQEKPLPPTRTSSYITAVTSAAHPPGPHPSRLHPFGSHPLEQEETIALEHLSGQGPSEGEVSGHGPSSSLPDPDFLDEPHTAAFYARMSTYQKPRGGARPQSAPATRHQYLPYTSHTDPLALAPPKLYPTGPPVSVAVLKSRSVPFYTATSYVIPRYNTHPVETQHCMPVRCHRESTGSGSSTPRAALSRSHAMSDTRMSYHYRQGSSHSADEREFRRRHASQQSFDSSTHSHPLSRKHHRVSLPPPGQFSSQPAFPAGSHGSVESGGSPSSGQATPLRAPSTPIVAPVIEGEILAFDFSGSMPPDATDNRDHEPRQVHIEKKDTLGISITPGNCGGIYVCNVKEGSVAQKAGLRYGDQLLEYNGVNLRCATYEQAAKILKESGNSVTILAQFNPQRNWDADINLSNSESSTACSTPINRRKVKRDDSTITPPIPRDEKVVPVSDVEPPGDLRWVYLKRSSSSLGFNITGGNATGIFVSELDSGKDRPSGLNVGDQILEYNGMDMTMCTAEQAMLELCKPTADSAQVLVQYNPTKYNSIKDQPGDSFYVRALYQRVAHSKDELSFKKGDILYITDSMHLGYVGCWRACLVSPEDALKRESGMVPSRTKAEQEILLRRSLVLAHGDDHKLSGRRSLFRRSKKSTHGLVVNHSREGSDSAASITTMCSDLGVVSYQTVEKLDSHLPRTVILFGPFSEVFCEKLATDFPYKFTLFKPELMNLSEEKIEKKVAEGKLVDYTWKAGQLHCLTLSAIKNVTDKHLLLTVSPHAVERLHALQVYPIVLYVKFKSFRQIKDLRDSKYIPEKMTSRNAKDLHESSLRLERDFKHLFNASVHGNSTTHICTAIQEAVAEQQKKTIWVPLSSV
ncbi:disks large homolog 5 isoform X2 [Nematostella vectensis]|uniref:disks large homolog 5 isoform X2 n=1 Tax=Nematostella vectensis TaxID=45351 RepID=UPI001390134C|nr:disks large homolog 5 isoform X2 [Nematostella vectensis]